MTPEHIKLQKILNDSLKEIVKNATIKDCSHPKKSECKLPIKSAHSLQKNGVLKNLEKTVKGNSFIYSHYARKISDDGSFLDLDEIGKGEASTFFGFCDYHDTVLFEKIENDANSIDIHNDEHCFLNSYRSFSHSYHRKYEQLKLLTSKNSETQVLLKKKYGLKYEEILKGVQLAIKDFEVPKKKLDNFLLEKKWDALEYLCYEFNHTIPIACASSVTPSHFYDGDEFNLSYLSKEFYSDIFTTVLPLQNKSIVILSSFSDDQKGIKYLDQIENIKNRLELEKFLTFHILINSENVFLSPYFYDRMSNNWKRKYCNLLDFNADNSTPFFMFNKKFPINYFDKTVSVNYLKNK